MSSSNNTTFDTLITIPIYFHKYVATIFYIIGNIGNLLSLVIFFKRSWSKNVCVFYFIICLISNTIFLNSTVIGSTLIFGFNIDLSNSNDIICKLFYYISYLTSTHYPTVLIFASFDRLLISSQNVDTRLYSSKRLAYTFVITNFVFWSIFSFHILIKVSIQQFDVNLFVCYYEISIFYLNFVLYSTAVFSIIIPIVLLVLSILSFENVRRIRAIPRQQRQQIRTMRKKDFQLLRCLYIHNIVYIICSTTIIIGTCYSVISNFRTMTPAEQDVATFLNHFGSFLHYIPYCTSFGIFISVSKAFRQEVKQMVDRICGKNPLIIQTEEVNHAHELKAENIELNTVVVSTIVLPRQ